MDIQSYVVELIKTQNQVGINGLGTFFKKKVPGRYDAVSRSYLPPSCRLEFKADVLENESLIRLISVEKNISEDSARYYIEEFAKDAQSALARSEEVDFGALGKLEKHLDGYSVSGKMESTFCHDFYGYPRLPENTSISSSPAVSPGLPVDVLSETEKSLSNNTQNLQEPVPLEAVKDGDTEQRRGMPAYIKIIIIGAIIFAAAVIAYVANPGLFGGLNTTKLNSKNTSQHSITDSLKKENINIAERDTIAGQIDSSLADSANGKPQISQLTAPLDTLVSYEIIAASLANKKEADRFLQNMEKRGIPAKVADMPGRRIKISIGTFIDEAEAKENLRLLKKSTKIPGIYIFTKKHTNK